MMSQLKLFGMRRSLKLKAYVDSVRKEIHDDRYHAKMKAR
jgi:hypothetical protein